MMTNSNDEDGDGDEERDDDGDEDVDDDDDDHDDDDGDGDDDDVRYIEIWGQRRCRECCLAMDQTGEMPDMEGIAPISYDKLVESLSVEQKAHTRIAAQLAQAGDMRQELEFLLQSSGGNFGVAAHSAPTPPSQEELRQRLFEVGAEAQLTELLQALRGKRVDRREAIALAEHALFEGLLFKHRHFTTFVSGLGRRSAWPQALGMFREMQHQEMDRRSAKPDIVSYSTTVVACEKASEWAAALSLFSFLREASVQVDAFGVSAALSACGKGGLWALALDMLTEMSEKSVTPDLFCFNGALSALGRAQLWEETLQHLRMLQSAEGIAPDAVRCLA
eukprot:s113_g5.t1